MTTNIIFLADIGKKINENEQKLAKKERALFYIVLIIIPTFSFNSYNFLINLYGLIGHTLSNPLV